MKTLADYPTFLHPLFLAVAKATDRPQVHPGVLEAITDDFPGFTPGQTVSIRHVTGQASGSRKGYYEVSLKGPGVVLGWKLRSGELQSLAQEALRNGVADCHPERLVPGVVPPEAASP